METSNRVLDDVSLTVRNGRGKDMPHVVQIGHRIADAFARLLLDRP